MTTTNNVLQMDGKEFKRNQLDKLVTSITIADEMAAGTFEITDLSGPERAQLADQLAQAAGILELCSVKAKEQQKPDLVFEMYSEFQRIYTEYSLQVATLSGAFASMEELTNHVAGVTKVVGEQCHHYQVDPLAFHKMAMDLSGGEYVDQKEKPRKKCWEFWK